MTNRTPTTRSGSPPPALVTAVRRLLRPLVGLMMEYGLTFRWLSALLKSVYVDVAEREFRLPEKRQTDSRITLLTGVHRKDVRRLRRELPREEGPPESVFIGAQVVAMWTGDDRFLDDAGEPRPLPRLHRGGDEPSFETLVTQVSKDIRPRVVLDEWLRLGAVSLDDDDRVVLKADAFVPAHGFDEKAYYLGRNIHDHLAAARHNVQGGEPPLLERSVYYDQLSPESVRILAELAEREGMKAIRVLNRRARELQDQDRKAAGRATWRMNFGVYYYGVDHDTEADPPLPDDVDKD